MTRHRLHPDLAGSKGSELMAVSKLASSQYVHPLEEHGVIDRLEPLLSALDSRSCIASGATHVVPLLMGSADKTSFSSHKKPPKAEVSSVLTSYLEIQVSTSSEPYSAFQDFSFE